MLLIFLPPVTVVESSCDQAGARDLGVDQYWGLQLGIRVEGTAIVSQKQHIEDKNAHWGARAGAWNSCDRCLCQPASERWPGDIAEWRSRDPPMGWKDRERGARVISLQDDYNRGHAAIELPNHCVSLLVTSSWDAGTGHRESDIELRGGCWIRHSNLIFNLYAWLLGKGETNPRITEVGWHLQSFGSLLHYAWHWRLCFGHKSNTPGPP